MMAGYVHRAGLVEAPFARSNGNGKATVYNPNSPSPTPLQNFVKAKEKINQVFKDIQQYVHETVEFLQGGAKNKDLFPKELVAESRAFEDSVATIREVLARDHMKVVFFGRTSNGKSTCINAMLHSKVLPSGIGHTTRCFVQVEGSATGSKHVLTESSTETKSIEALDQLANSLCSSELGEDALVRICWPKTDSKLLQNEVVLVDSPGIDVSPQFDAWIDKHCLDADVFVLVSNAESTLTQTEKNFFHRVSERVSKPNIFILNNRWDASANEPEHMEQVRAQHTSRFIRFLVDELQVCGAEDVKHRVFFVSAREALCARLRERGVQSPGTAMAEGFQARILEFEDFEKQFELCISHSAINTKFETHIEKGKTIARNLHEILEKVGRSVGEAKLQSDQALHDSVMTLRTSQKKLLHFIEDSRQKIQHLSAEVQLKISHDLSDEVRRLEGVIDSFGGVFSDDPAFLEKYKQELTAYVEDYLHSSLTGRSTIGLLDRITNTEKEFISDVVDLVPPTWSAKASNVVAFREPFRFTFAFNCGALMEEFQEDLEFRFSLGISALIRRLSQFRSGAAAPRPATQQSLLRDDSSGVMFGSSSFIPKPILSEEDTYYASTGAASRTHAQSHEDAVMTSLIYTSATYVANGGVGLLVGAGLVYRTVGWKIIGAAAGIYLLLYLYERISWNARTKEQSFKSQFRKHLARQLRRISNSIIQSGEGQATREVQELLGRLQKLSCEAHREMKEEVDRLQLDVEELERLNKALAQTKGKATFFGAELESFAELFLRKSPSK